MWAVGVLQTCRVNVITSTVEPVTDDLSRWYRAAIGSTSEREVLRRLREHLREPFDTRKLATHLRQGDPNARTVSAIAHLFGASAVEGLIAGGVLGESDLRQAGVAATLREATDRELADEVGRRLVDRTYGPRAVLNRPMREVELPGHEGAGA